MIAELTGGRGWPFGGTVADLTAAGYEEREYAVAGEATYYRFIGDETYRYDGRWRVEPAGTRPYRTRVIVRQPTDPGRFNGTILVNWNNVSAGFEGRTDFVPGVTEEGFAQVCVSAQRVGIHGLPNGRPIGLQRWDPTRYGSLSIPNDDLSYGIFTSATQLALQHSGLDGKVVALGASQSAIRLATYYNAIQPLTRMFDGFLLEVWRGAGALVDSTDPTPPRYDFGEMTEVVHVLRDAHQLRDDMGVPVLLLNTETEARTYDAARQPDTQSFRLWEIAGAAHASTDQWEMHRSATLRDFGNDSPSPFTPLDDHNTVAVDPVRETALVWMNRWVHGGPPPPSQPQIEVTGDPPEITRDEHGNARGGLRLPDMEVPTATNIGERQHPTDMYGRSTAFPPELLTSLYREPARYRARYNTAVDAAVEAGVLLPRGARRLKQRRSSFDW